MDGRKFRTSYESFSKAIEKACPPEFRDQMWPIYSSYGYEITGSGDERHVRAVNPLREEIEDNGAEGEEDFDWLLNQAYEKTLEGLEKDLEIYNPDEKEAQLTYGRVYLRRYMEAGGDREVEESRKNPKQWVPFRPLRRPGLIQEFADLHNGDLSEKVILEWVHEYGVLGLYGVPDKGSFWENIAWHPSHGGSGETINNFRSEVEIAWMILNSYEALTAGGQEREPDVEALREIFERPAHIAASEIIDKAVYTMERFLNLRLERLCYIHQCRQDESWGMGYGFHSLLGAMYLQMAWLMQGTLLPRTCKGPKCSELLLPGGDKNSGRHKEFCSERCRNSWYYRYRTKPRRQGKPPLA